ncbi:uncharacterized protein LOC128616317 [Ictalurus furcatus]|uniref:uncharacterized protein LOC128616317 n=1 Tax=Ictalurus furcatus TaxID=66913 RepID=UPI002350986F|nr:uncharacterized protein LOC128616317 [Ictalurus furcatus]
MTWYQFRRRFKFVGASSLCPLSNNHLFPPSCLDSTFSVWYDEGIKQVKNLNADGVFGSFANLEAKPPPGGGGFSIFLISFSFVSIKRKKTVNVYCCVLLNLFLFFFQWNIREREGRREEKRLRKCDISDEGCAALASALRSNPSHLRELYLAENNLGDSGVKCLSAGLENPHCKLGILELECCGVSGEGCAALASALRSNPSHLRELDLTKNNLGDSEVKCLSALKNDEHYKLHTLRLPTSLF